MPKPVAYKPKQIEKLFAATGARAYVAALRELTQGSVPFELTLAIAAHVGARAVRSKYDAGAPASYLTAVGAVALLDFLPASDHGLALVQAVSAAASEGLPPVPNFAGWPWKHDLDHEASQTDMDGSWAEAALTRFHGRLVPFINEETRRKYGHRYLYTRSVLDLANDGHRHIVTGAGVRMAEQLRWRETEQTLYAASHYWVHATQDYALAEQLQTWLDSLDSGIHGDNRRRTPTLTPALRAELESLVFGGDDIAMFNRVHEIWNEGFSLEALIEPCFTLGCRALRDQNTRDQGARVLAFADTCIGSFPWLRGADGIVQVLMAMLFTRGQLTERPTASHEPDDGAAGDEATALQALAQRAIAVDQAGITPPMCTTASVLSYYRRSPREDKRDLLKCLEVSLADRTVSELRSNWSN